MTPEFLEACLARDFDAASRLIGLLLPSDWVVKDSTFQRRLDQLKEDPNFQPWSLRAIALGDEDVLVGQIGFHTLPAPEYLRGYAPQGVEIGYTIFPKFRGQGFATEACLALMEWAHRNHGVHDFVLSISPENAPSLRIAQRLGFVAIGSEMDDEDGEETVFLGHFPIPIS